MSTQKRPSTAESLGIYQSQKGLWDRETDNKSGWQKDLWATVLRCWNEPIDRRLHAYGLTYQQLKSIRATARQNFWTTWWASNFSQMCETIQHTLKTFSSSSQLILKLSCTAQWKLATEPSFCRVLTRLASFADKRDFQ